MKECVRTSSSVKSSNFGVAGTTGGSDSASSSMANVDAFFFEAAGVFKAAEATDRPAGSSTSSSSLNTTNLPFAALAFLFFASVARFASLPFGFITAPPIFSTSRTFSLMRVLRGSSEGQALPAARSGASSASSNISRRRPFWEEDEDEARMGGAGAEKTSLVSERAGPVPVRAVVPDLLVEDDEVGAAGIGTLPSTVLRGAAAVVEAGVCAVGVGSDSVEGTPAVVIILI